MQYAFLAAVWMVTLASVVLRELPLAVALMVACFIYSGFVEHRKRRQH